MSDSQIEFFWKMLRLFSDSGKSVKFTLIYDGQLPPSDSKRAIYASKIRNAVHPQLADLWDNHVIMRQLRHDARVKNHSMVDIALSSKPPNLSDYLDPLPPLKENQIDLCAPLPLLGVGGFLPIVRKSLYLACQIDILFLRHEEPGRLFENGGDIDNRLKCFFDGLTVPNAEQAKKGEEPCSNPLCCLLEDDKLISDFSVRTARLLGRSEKSQYDVRIQADITIKVLRIFDPNQALLGG